MTRYLRERTLFGPLIKVEPSSDLGLCVVIPARDESESLLQSLASLRACDSTTGSAEVIVVVNTSETDSSEIVARNAESAALARDWAAEDGNGRLRFHILEAHGLPRKHAGVGLARKIGMDEACRRLERVGRPDGVIACFDADSRCDPNYLAEIESLFRIDEAAQACSIHFEHPLEGDEFSSEIYHAITDYELHLRTYVNAQRFAGFPFATQTIGSSMAVRCVAYQAQNGMNRRQAGEDFYFLHKFTPLGNVRELNTTRVIPSPRASHRVPFGTGRAVGERINEGGPCLTYAPASFLDLGEFFGRLDDGFESKFDHLPDSIGAFLETQAFSERLSEIRANVTNAEAFRVRFFRWFNAFLVMKYLHFARDRYHPDVEVTEAARWLLEQRGEPAPLSARELLLRWREIDRTRSAAAPPVADLCRRGR
ncbi:MAG: glycosyltransferase family 2 protein [Verrucomicrobiae bacterium]|nr:glycosyltransferase family 2 protein [Verrucomicrobiae bacterium]